MTTESFNRTTPLVIKALASVKNELPAAELRAGGAGGRPDAVHPLQEPPELHGGHHRAN